MIYFPGKSMIYCHDNYGIVNDYYQMIINLLKYILENNNDIYINIIVGNDSYNFNNTNKNLRIQINYEHILVKQGGRSSNGSPIGTIKDNTNTNYLVRIDRFDELNKADIIIDYSIPNIHHTTVSNKFNILASKMIYIASSIYDIYHIKEYRYIETLTTFINTNEPRRKTLLETIDKIGIPHININNCFNKDKLQVLYKDTKVLINIHQTPHHDTFEELRILPALQCGVLVVCENSPLNELIPYNDYIIWSDYDSIVSKVKDVLENYDHYYKKIFGNLHAKKIQLSELNAINYKTLYDSLIKTSISLV